MNSHGILVVFVVLLAKCLKRLTNTRTPYALVHMTATLTAFHYELVTRGSACTWSLCHVVCTESVRILRGIDHAFYWLLLTGIDGPDLYALKRTSWEATRSPNVRTTPPNNDFTAPFFREAKWPPTSSGSTVAIVSRAKTKMPTCLYCTDIRIIISFLAVRID